MREILELGLKNDDEHRIFGWPPPLPNPYPAVLGLAERFLVTCDSANMIADACVTGKRVEVPLVVIVRVRDGKLAHEHIYWDQASVLAQLGLIDADKLPVGAAASARKALDPGLAANTLIRRAGL